MYPGTGAVYNFLALVRVTVFLVGVITTLSACTLLPGLGWKSEPETELKAEFATGRSTLVAMNLVDVMAQIPELQPHRTVLSFARPDSSYGRILARQLQRAGYGLRQSANPRARNHLAYTILATGSDKGPEYEFTLAVGKIKVRRLYALEGSQIYPASSLFILGSEPDGIVLDDTIFAGQRDRDGRESEPVRSMQPEKALAKTAAPKPILDSATDLLPPAPVVNALAKENMYEIRRSNYVDQVVGYDDVQRSIIIFPNDSVVLGKTNRQLTRDLVSGFDPTTDVISVIGCSHGKTAISDGNRKLALGRSSRIREELIRAGIDGRYVLDEGCWAPVPFDEKMPRRGVVLTLKRLRGIG